MEDIPNPTGGIHLAIHNNDSRMLSHLIEEASPVFHLIEKASPVFHLIEEASPSPAIDEKYFGFTPLLHAVIKGSIEMVDILLSNAANSSIKNNSGCTPLTVSVANGNTNMVALLLYHGANPNTQDDSTGNTPLIVAAIHGFVPIVAELLRYKPLVFVKNLDGDTAFAIALRKSKPYSGQRPAERKWFRSIAEMIWKRQWEIPRRRTIVLSEEQLHAISRPPPRDAVYDTESDDDHNDGVTQQSPFVRSYDMSVSSDDGHRVFYDTESDDGAIQQSPFVHSYNLSDSGVD
jgi:hypothetical protein